MPFGEPAGKDLRLEMLELSRLAKEVGLVGRDEIEHPNSLRLVPLGQGSDRTYITAGLPNAPPHELDRSQLFRPGLRPVGVVLPDNAWHLGFCSVPVAPDGGFSLTA